MLEKQLDNIPSGFFGVVGLFIGSFLNVCIYRLPRQESLVWPGSHCPACGRFIKPLELIPVVSYLLQRGRCRTCGETISLKYPVVELITGVVFYWAAGYADGDVLKFTSAILFLSGLVVVFFVYLSHWIIPDKVVFPLTAVGLVLSAFQGTFLSSIAAAAVGFFGFYAIAWLGTLLLKKEAMGGGDIKLAGMIGCYLGMRLMLAGFFLAFLIGAIVSLPLLLTRRREAQDPVPFGPMMSVGAALALIKGTELLDWYGDWMVRIWLY